jgi:D-glycero-D-manno-heptose 1,7-bisphosphate phosphatase
LLRVNKAFFLDRDGVINRDKAYVSKKEDFEWLPGVFDACQRINRAGYLIVVVTNQSGIGRGYYTEQDFADLTHWMSEELQSRGIPLAGVYYSPFHATEGIGPYKKASDCRKPGPKMILDAAKDHNIDCQQSVIIGDRASDIEAGRRAGVGQLVYIGEPGVIEDSSVLTADSLLSAVNQMLAKSNGN